MRPIGSKSHSLALLVILSFFAINHTLAVANGEGIKHTGTFSSMYFNEEGGDLLGIELKIVLTDNGYQGVFQQGQGVASELSIVKPIIQGNSIIIPFFEGDKKVGEFKGLYTDFGIIPKDQTNQDWWWRLKRQPSYWDQYRNSPE